MTHTLKTLAAASLLTAFAAPAFAMTQVDLSSLTCEDYNSLGGAERDRVAVLAVKELNDDVMPTDGTATANESSVGTTAEESERATSQGSAVASTISEADDDLARMQEEIGVLNRTCARSADAMILEAAAGQDGTR